MSNLKYKTKYRSTILHSSYFMSMQRVWISGLDWAILITERKQSISLSTLV